MTMARLLSLCLAACLLACGESAPQRSHAQAESPSEPREPPTLPYVEQLVGGATPGEGPLPLLVTLHGRGSTPASFQQFFTGMRSPARIVHLEAPIDEGNGRAWWSFRGKTRAEVAQIIHDLAELTVASLRVAERERPALGEPALLGFSQGAMIVYAVGFDFPDAFGRLYPISGVFFESLLPPDAAARVSSLPPIHVMHGEADPIIGMRWGVGSVEPLIALGAEVHVQTFPDVPHWIMRGMRTGLHTSLAEYIESQRAPR